MAYIEKVKGREALRSSVQAARDQGQKVVQCHGCFDILHPGHVRHLAWAKRQGDILVVTVSADHVIQKGDDRPYVPQNLRAENLAALEMVDYVSIDDGEWAGPILDYIRPDVFVKGKEFEYVYDGRFGRERALVAGYGGQTRFSSGDVDFSSSRIIQRFADELSSVANLDEQFRDRNGIEIGLIGERLRRFGAYRVLVVGDVGLSRQVSCDAEGMSGNTMGLVWRSVESGLHPLGAAQAAQHLDRMGAEVVLLGTTGPDDEAGSLKADLSPRIENRIVQEEGRETTVTTQYLAENQILLNVTNQHSARPSESTECELLDEIDRVADGIHAIVLSDLGYGTVTAPVLDRLNTIAQERSVPIVGEVGFRQSQPDVARLKRVDVTVCTERTARIAHGRPDSGVADLGALLLRDGLAASAILLLEEGGLIVLDTKGREPETLRSLEHSHEMKEQLAIEFLQSPDAALVGAGGKTSALAGAIALGLASGASIMETAYIAKWVSYVDARYGDITEDSLQNAFASQSQ